MPETCSGLGSLLIRSPSLREHSSGTMAHIAARVVTHCYNPNDAVSFSPATPCRNDAFRSHENIQEDSDSEFEFEFAVPGIGEYSSPIPADQIFHNGQIKPLFPVSNTNLINRSPICPIRLPLIQLMITERQTTLTESISCSSSETDDLEGVAPETYCVWTPNKKSQSTGSSKRWRLRDLLYRSHSDGEALEFSKNSHKKERQPMKKKAKGENDRKMSFLIGWFANMNGLSRTVQPF